MILYRTNKSLSNVVARRIAMNLLLDIAASSICNPRVNKSIAASNGIPYCESRAPKTLNADCEFWRDSFTNINILLEQLPIDAKEVTISSFTYHLPLLLGDAEIELLATSRLFLLAPLL